MSWTILDLQGFKSNDNNFIVKELFILKEKSSFSFLFKPPFAEGELTSKAWLAKEYCTKNIHGLEWDSGDVPYTQLEEIIKTNCQTDRVMCKGSEKAGFFKKILEKPIFDLDQVLFKKLELLPISSVINCPNDHQGYTCAKKNCYKMLDWWEKLDNVL